MTSTLHMDVPQCRNVSTTINSTQSDIESQLSTLASLVSGTVGAEWIAPAANQFLEDYNAWNANMKSLLAELAELKARLDKEIAEWETTGSTY